ncbi:hypothetical protein JCM8097_005514 [Rhodosporidiobolus ruineniae]
MESLTVAALPAVVDSLTSSLNALPAALTSANLSLLADHLSKLSNDLTPVLPDLAADQQETLLTNSTWLAEQLSQLSAITSQIPSADVQHATQADLIAMIQTGSRRYDIWTLWAPEIWAITLMFLIAGLFKIALCFLLKSAAVKRAQQLLEDKGSPGIDLELGRAALQKPARSMLGHFLNLVIGTAALVLQLLAWRFFAIPSEHMRIEDVQYFSIAMKILLVGYAADLLFGDVRPEIYLHHTFTFALLLIGQMAVYQTKSPKFFFMACWLLCQGTTEQSTYAGMVAYHAYTYLRVQNHRPALQARLLKWAYALLWFTKWITFPQKLVPAAFSLYWLGRMWNDIDPMIWGRAWLGFSTAVIALLLVLQVKFCDDVFPLCNYIGYKLHGGPLPSRRGPVMRLLCLPFSRHSRSSPSHPPKRISNASDVTAVDAEAAVGMGRSSPYPEKEEGVGRVLEAAEEQGTRYSRQYASVPQGAQSPASRPGSPAPRPPMHRRTSTETLTNDSIRNFRPLSMVDSVEGGGGSEEVGGLLLGYEAIELGRVQGTESRAQSRADSRTGSVGR